MCTTCAAILHTVPLTMFVVTRILFASFLAWDAVQAFSHSSRPLVAFRCHGLRFERRECNRPQCTSVGILNTKMKLEDRSDISLNNPLRENLTRGDFIRSASLAALTVYTATVEKSATAATGTDTPSSEGVGTTIASDDKRDWRLRDYMALVAAEETTSQSAVSGLVAGAAVSTAKQILLYPVDTIKTRLQVKRNASDWGNQELFRGLYEGILPPLLIGAPSGALFFSVKDACSTAISNSVGTGYADLTTVVAVGLAQFPCWGLRTPAELLKTRSQAGISRRGASNGDVAEAKSIVADEGIQGLYTGYLSNIAYAFPADAIKFLVYGALKRSAREAKGGAKLGTLEAAVLGSGASMIAQAVTTPLDVVRTRVMTASEDDQPFEGGVPGALGAIARKEGFARLWAGTLPRVARSILSGAIQFGSYEFVKGLFGVEPRKL